jgi:hypothetical protein
MMIRPTLVTGIAVTVLLAALRLVTLPRLTRSALAATRLACGLPVGATAGELAFILIRSVLQTALCLV